ncbi:MAG: SDR family oxidoreductase [Bacteroidia bacterium]
MEKYVLILGAKSDIGRALAREYAAAGYHIYLAARKVEEIEDDAKDLQIRYGIKASAHAFDATKYETHLSFYQQFTSQPDTVIAVFGVLYEQEKAQNDWQLALNTMKVNYVGAVSILEIAARSMEKQQSGTIIGISSVAGDRGRASNYLYGSAKAGFTAYLSGLRNRLAKANVHVLTVKPGFVKTAMTQNLALPPVITGQPQQVAKDIFKAAQKKKNELYTLWMWKYIMLIIKSIPEFVFKKMKL